MVSTNFKHINANIIICCCKFLFGTNWIHWYHVGVGSSCGKQVHLCDNENGFLYLSWKHSDFQGLSRTVSLSFITNDLATPVYFEWPIRSSAVWLSGERLSGLKESFAIGAGSWRCPAPYWNLVTVLCLCIILLISLTDWVRPDLPGFPVRAWTDLPVRGCSR